MVRSSSRSDAATRRPLLIAAAAALITLGMGGGVARASSVLTDPNPPVPSGPPTPQLSDPPTATGRDQALSDERTYTRWAFAARSAPIFRYPSARSTRVTRAHLYTEEGYSEVYLTLRSHRDGANQEWILVRIPMRPNGRTGWVRRDALGTFHLTHQQLVVDRQRLRIYLFDHGRPRWSAPVGVGKAASPTPAGHYWIRERIVVTDRRSGYWPYALGTADYSTLTDWPGGGVVGIHGPYFQPQLIPGRVSHGCIRLHTSDDAWLAGHVSVGTPLQIR